MWLSALRDAELGQMLRGKQVLVAIWKTERSNSGVCAPRSDWELGLLLNHGLDFGDKGTGLGPEWFSAERDFERKPERN